jgi:hypothetical protein
MIFFIVEKKIKIYQKGPSEYELFQEIADSEDNLVKVSVGEKGNIFAVAERLSGKLRIYHR